MKELVTAACELAPVKFNTSFNILNVSFYFKYTNGQVCACDVFKILFVLFSKLVVLVFHLSLLTEREFV